MSSSSSPRIKIRCPNCHKDGSARAELVNRRVSCKHCSHAFRAVAIGDSDEASPAQPPESPDRPSRQQIDALEREIRQLRDDLSVDHAAAGEVATLREKLKGALEDKRSTEAREKALQKELQDLRDRLDETIPTTGDERLTGLREQELRFLREQLDRSRAEAEAEVRKRRDATSTLAARTAEHAQTLTDKEAEHAQALADKEAQHGETIRLLQEQLEQARAETQGFEARRLADESARLESEDRRANEGLTLQSELDQARSELEALRLDRETAVAEQARLVEELRGQLAQAESKLGDAEATRTHLDSLTAELETHRNQLAEVKAGAEVSRLDRERIEAAHAAELADLHDQLQAAKVGLDLADATRRERDEAIIQRNRLAEELDALQARLDEAESLSTAWGYSSTELEVPAAKASGEASAEIGAVEPESATVYDDSKAVQAEVDTLRAELTQMIELLRQKDEELAALALERDQSLATDRETRRLEVERVAEQGQAQIETIRLELAQAKEAAEAASRSNEELTLRIRNLEAGPLSVAEPIAAVAAAVDPALIEAERKRAVDEAVKGAWADFERRLAETQAKLKAANARADLMENEARESREQFAARERALDLGDGSSFEEATSMTSIRILSDRGTARLTLSDAEARLDLARQTAVDRKDKALIDRIGKMAQKVRDDLEARNYTLAETLVRGAEIETGLDPGGFSINGLRIFRASQTIVGSLAGLAPAFERVMRAGELNPIRSTIEEMRTILGDQAGLPEIRRLGRTPAVKRPITEVDALRLFLGALEGENWLLRPIASKKPLPETSLTTYACLVEACSEARAFAERLAPDRVIFLDGVIQAACATLLRRQQPDGHFAFLDPRGKASRLASVVDAMVAQHPGAVKDGWVIQVDPLGMAQTETAACALALTAAAKSTGRPEWTKAAQKAADWAMDQPCLPNFAANAASAELLARTYLAARQDRHLIGLTKKLALGLLPGQVENGRWIDPHSATTPNHLAIIRALQDAWEALPPDRVDLRREVKGSLDMAMASLFAEAKALGVPPLGNALRVLIRQRDLFPTEVEPRLDPAILDSATLIQELCHDGPKPKLGVAADQLVALMRAN